MNDGQTVLIWSADDVVAELLPFARQLANAGATPHFALRWPGTAQQLRDAGFGASEIVTSFEGDEDDARLDLTGVEFEQVAQYELACSDWPDLGLIGGFARGFGELLDELRPDVLVLWEGLTLPGSLFAAIARARGLTTWFAQRGPFEGTICIDPAGVGANASYAAQGDAKELAVESTVRRAEVRAMGREVVEFSRTVRGKRRDLPTQLMLNPSGRTLLYVARPDGDPEVKLFAPDFPTNLDAITALLDATTDTNWQIVVLPIDVDVEALRRQCADLTGRVAITDSKDFGGVICGVHAITVRGGREGFDALLWGVPTIGMGEAVYTGKGLTIDVRSADEIAIELRADQLAAPSRERLESFIGLLARDRLMGGVIGENARLVDSILSSAACNPLLRRSA